MNDESFFWDYEKCSEIKFLERIGLFFPQLGRNKNIVVQLYRNLHKLNIPEENKKLIKLYYQLIENGELA